MRDLTWYSVFLHRVPRHLGLHSPVFVPIGQNLDPDIDISRNITAHGAIFALAGLLIVSVLGLDLPPPLPDRILRMVRLADSAGAHFVLAPIRDPMAERRMYLPFIGLLFIASNFCGAGRPRGTFLSARSRWFWWWKAR
jgi:hypothetical protein